MESQEYRRQIGLKNGFFSRTKRCVVFLDILQKARDCLRRYCPHLSTRWQQTFRISACTQPGSFLRGAVPAEAPFGDLLEVVLRLHPERGRCFAHRDLKSGHFVAPTDLV